MTDETKHKLEQYTKQAQDLRCKAGMLEKRALKMKTEAARLDALARRLKVKIGTRLFTDTPTWPSAALPPAASAAPVAAPCASPAPSHPLR